MTVLTWKTFHETCKKHDTLYCRWWMFYLFTRLQWIFRGMGGITVFNWRFIYKIRGAVKVYFLKSQLDSNKNIVTHKWNLKFIRKNLRTLRKSHRIVRIRSEHSFLSFWSSFRNFAVSVSKFVALSATLQFLSTNLQFFTNLAILSTVSQILSVELSYFSKN